MKRMVAPLCGLLVVVLAIAFLGRTAEGQSGSAIELVSVLPSGLAAGLSGTDEAAALALNGQFMIRNRFAGAGRYVVYESSRFGLDPSDVTLARKILVRDRQAGTNTIVSLATDGAQANRDSYEPVITPDGRFVAFTSAATNLTPGDTNGTLDIFVRDVQARTTSRVSASSSGAQSNLPSHMAGISDDGRYVTFASLASNLVPGDTNNSEDVFVHDRVAGTTERLSVNGTGEQGTGPSYNPAISADGRYVLFESGAPNLIANDLNGFSDIFIRDRQLGTTMLVSIATTGGVPNFGARHPSMSPDARFVVYASFATNIVTPNNGNYSVYLYDRQTSTTRRVSVASDGTQNNQAAWMPSVSADGRYVVFESLAGNLADGDSDNWDIFRHDTVLGTNEVVARISNISVVSADGSLVYFQSAAGLLPSDTNFMFDVYLYGPPSSNGPPDAVDDTATTAEDTAVNVPVLANDTAPEGNPLAIQAFTQGAHGAVVRADGQTLTYTPAANFSGSDTFQYTVADSRGDIDTATVTITVTPVNDRPVATADRYSTYLNVPVNIGAALGVLANDADIDGDSLTAVVVTGPLRGTVSLAPDGSFSYRSHEGFTGTDTFTYRAFDPQQAGSDPATVTIVVEDRIAGQTSSCRPVVPATIHRVTGNPMCDVLGEPFLVNRRLALIEDNTVPCVEVDTMEVTRCTFRTGPTSQLDRRALASGHWMADRDGRRYAVVGQPITRDGSLASGNFIVGTIPDADGSVACVGATGRDLPARTSLAGAGPPEAIDLGATGMLELAGSDQNFSGIALQNVADLVVCSSTLRHPDNALQVSLDAASGIACYTGIGAALNDPSGEERDPWGYYYGADWSLHFVELNGVQVPAAKRPSTKSYPPPGVVNIKSPIRWLPMNPYVTIANGPPIDPRPVSPPIAAFTVSVGRTTVRLDASASVGDIVSYRWDFSWTTMTSPDLVTASPTAEFPLVANVTQGVIDLTVVARDGQTAVVSQPVNFRHRILPFSINPTIPRRE
jgi:Tol biopolymer transport system component